MRLMTKVAALAGTTILAATAVAMSPAEAALITKPVTSGYAQIVLDAPLSTAFSATSPGRTGKNGMFFPVTAATSSTIALAGNMRIMDPSTGQVMDYPISLSIDRPSGTAEVVISLSGVSQTVLAANNLEDRWTRRVRECQEQDPNRVDHVDRRHAPHGGPIDRRQLNQDLRHVLPAERQSRRLRPEGHGDVSMQERQVHEAAGTEGQSSGGTFVAIG